MTTAKELLEEEDKAWHELKLRLDKLGPDDWERPGAAGDWSAKDVIAHIAAWHAEAVHQMEQFRETGHVKRTWKDVQSFNDDAYAQCQDLSLHDARVTSGASRHRFREEISCCAEPLNEKTAALIAGCAHEHYRAHIEWLDRFIGTSA